MNMQEVLSLASKIGADNIIDAYVAERNLPENYMEVLQYQVLGQQAYNDGNYKEAESYFAALVVGLQKLKEEDPTLFLNEIMLSMFIGDNFRMQGKNREALAHYAKLIAVASDSEKLDEIRAIVEMWKDQMGALAPLMGAFADAFSEEGFATIVANAYTFFAESAQSVPEIPFISVEQVIEEGLAYVETTGHPKWASSLRLRRAYVWSEYGKAKEALQEAEVALGLAFQHKEDSAGYGLSYFRNTIARFHLDLERYDDAIQTAQEILGIAEIGSNTKGEACIILSLGYTGLSMLDEARKYAEMAIELFINTKESLRLARAYSALANVALKEGRLLDATSAAAKGWNLIRRDKPPVPLIVPIRCTQVRLAQARAMLEVQPPVNQDRSSLRLKSAQRWLKQTEAIVSQSVVRGGGHPSVDIIAKIREEIASMGSITN